MTPTLDRDVCRCGRAVRLLNAASDTPKCPACGLPPELCPCGTPETCGCGGALIPTVAGRMVCDPCGEYQDVCSCYGEPRP